ncbi:acyl-CoA dehydrogenase C-terminal domain-containing protein [Microbulbifer agarilyticus]|uniref:acyl-CoA dehydrogenase C-terminal domain-containing protein n=1 Tax=Microbulbifer agarilyticus TaxID=260552 RepID=UPI001CD342BE|nr:acyl-CoA dehydrogenase C-terminal domain-containing protein [Microbulbifer agarilyticus]MCA0893450.1 acyl-CoA dehydrogenase C-terminal domain-containing protein [Microbulbifer agarilyticus]
MPFKAPIRDVQFLADKLLNAQQHYASLAGGEPLDCDLRNAILEEAARFSEEVLYPLNRNGDEQGCLWNEDGVKTPDGFADAYRQYIDGGWPGLSMPTAFGGQALPKSLDFMVSECLSQANHAWAMYPGLSAGCRGTLLAHGTESQQAIYLPKLTSGAWTGTMCLTEPQCGSDLSFLRTRAEAREDGSYSISGTKIFISAGEHDLSENIVHLVLARLPDAPAGTRGISLFIVPKFLPDRHGEPGARNAVQCGSLEHKMGIHGNATCVMNFDGAQGFLIGEPHRGLLAMFTFMNSARLGVALEGLAHGEVALQGALSYATEREAGRALSGAKAPTRPADRLVVHPDVRRMLLTIRALTEGSRALLHSLGQLVDIELGTDAEAAAEAASLLAFYTPIAKGFMTEMGIECANIGMQVYGGHGYIREWGMEQNLRDARITTMYEGTTGIQALDLLARKVLRDQGASLETVIVRIRADMEDMEADYAQRLSARLEEWQAITATLFNSVSENIDELGAASVDYLMYSGYVLLGWQWGRMASVSEVREGADAFYRAKAVTAHFYFDKILPRCSSLAEQIRAGADSLMALDDMDFDVLAGR